MTVQDLYDRLYELIEAGHGNRPVAYSDDAGYLEVDEAAPQELREGDKSRLVVEIA